MDEFECPYCGRKENPSDDHIFQDFFGGKQTIEACRDCNSTFGHEFEGRFINSLAPLIISLAICDLKPKRKVTWRDAFTDTETGTSYNLNSDLLAMAPQQVRHLEEGGFTFTASDQKLLKKDNLKRTAVKMCIGMLRYFKSRAQIHPMTMDYLLYENVEQVPAGIACFSYAALDSIREPLSHVIYVQGIKKQKFLYGIVQFFGTFQVYCILNGQYKGEDKSFMGQLNSLTFEESFTAVPGLNLILPFGEIPAEDYWPGCI